MGRSEVEIGVGAEARPAPPKQRMTYEEFLEWCDEDTWAEWVEGEVIVLTPASERHQALRGFLEAVLTIYVALYDLCSASEFAEYR